MKHRLLTIILTLTAVPLFLIATPIQQPTNAELLAHLQQVKAEMFNDKQNIDTNNESIFALNLLNEFYDKSKFLQQYVSNTINHDFDLICNNMMTWEQLFYIPIDQKQIIITDADEKELYILFESIYTKLHKLYCYDNPNGELAHTTAQDIFPEALDAIMFLDGLKMPNALAKKIDAKIAELEKQL